MKVRPLTKKMHNCLTLLQVGWIVVMICSVSIFSVAECYCIVKLDFGLLHSESYEHKSQRWPIQDNVRAVSVHEKLKVTESCVSSYLNIQPTYSHPFFVFITYQIFLFVKKESAEQALCHCGECLYNGNCWVHNVHLCHKS